MDERIKVLVVDSSAVFRQKLKRIFAAEPAIEVIATAPDPYIAANKMIAQAPDVITTDIETPRMDGITFLKKIMSQHPIPVIIISRLVENDTGLTSKAFQIGAAEVMSKSIFEVEMTEEEKLKICDIVKKVSRIKISKGISQDSAAIGRPKLSADAVLSDVRPKNLTHTSEKIIAVGASTGGTKAISTFLEALPANAPGVLIVQHMPENFTRSFAERLNGLCKISVKEAVDGDVVKPGRALVAPGNQHMLLRKKGIQYFVEIKEGSLVNRHRPSVDVLFRSAALYAGRNSIGILLTGMGDDGAKGLLEMKKIGATTIAQDEKSCVVFGMPKEAVMLNAVDKVLPIDEIAGYLLRNVI
jgi:two-component system chemotaxis response regulator CheB